MTKPNDRFSKIFGNLDPQLVALMKLGPLGAVLAGPELVSMLRRQATASNLHRVGSSPPTLRANTKAEPLSRPTSVSTTPRLRPSAYATGHVYEPFLQADAAVRGAASTFFGNEISAALDSTFLPGAPKWSGRFDTHLASEKARDTYDAAHRPAAQKIGQIGGLALAMLATRGRALPVARLPGAAMLSGRELTALAGGSALAGLGSQFAVDHFTGNKSSAGDLQGATLGGLVNGAFLPFGPKVAAGAGGAATSIAQDILNGRQVSLERLGRAVNVASVMGGLGDDVGAKAVDSLPPFSKGRVGEIIGSTRSTANTYMRDPGPKIFERFGPPGTYRPGTYLDGRSGVLRFEDKFGRNPTVSPGQFAAQEELGADFYLYHALPQDVGAALSLPPAIAGSQVVLERRRPRVLDDVTYEEALSRVANLPQATAVQARGR